MAGNKTRQPIGDGSVSDANLGINLVSDVLEGQIETYRVAFKNTGNPVYVWKTLRFFSPTAQAALFRAVDIASVPAAVLPHWCMEYLFQCAEAVEDLSWGRDPRDEERGELRDGQKTDLVAASFGFAKPGWNAFSQHDSISNMKWPERYFEELRDQKVSYSAALSETAERYGFEDERALRRRLAKRRKAYHDPEADNQEQGRT